MPFLTEAEWETFATCLLFDNIRLCPATAVLRVPGQVLLPLLPQQLHCHHPRTRPAEVGLPEGPHLQLLSGAAGEDVRGPSLQHSGHQSLTVPEGQAPEYLQGRVLRVQACKKP